MIEKKSKKQFNFSLNSRLTIGLVAVMLLAIVFGLIISSQTNSFLRNKIAEEKEAARPASIDIIVLQELSCKDCFNLSPLLNAVKKENVEVSSEKIIEMTSLEGMELINQYNITKVPTLVISGEIEKDANLKALWPQLGEIQDGVFVLRQVGAPYVLASSGDVIGRVRLTMIMDKNCAECYDVAQHMIILRNFGIFTQDQKVLDISLSQGEELIDEYQIKLLPTFILSGDVEAYPLLKTIWPKVGTVEKDGTYVFREGVKQMGAYKDLITNEIVKAADTNQGSSSLKQIKITGSEFSFNPASLTIKKGENIQLTFTNNGAVPHDFVLEELGIKTKILPVGQSETMSFTANQSGTFSFYCSVTGHRNAGMEGQLTVQ